MGYQYRRSAEVICLLDAEVVGGWTGDALAVVPKPWNPLNNPPDSGFWKDVAALWVTAPPLGSVCVKVAEALLAGAWAPPKIPNEGAVVEVVVMAGGSDGESVFFRANDPKRDVCCTGDALTPTGAATLELATVCRSPFVILLTSTPSGELKSNVLYDRKKRRISKTMKGTENWGN